MPSSGRECEYSGDHGGFKTFYKRAMEDAIAIEAEDIRKTRTVYAGQLIQAVLRHTQADSEAQRVAEMLLDMFADSTMLEQAQYGYYPSAQFPTAVEAYIRIAKTVFHANVASVISSVIAETAVPALATKAALATNAMLQVTEAAWQNQGNQPAPPAPAASSGSGTGTGTAPVPAPVVPAVVALAHLLHKGRPVSASMAVLQLYMAALKALYGLATQVELREYSDLIRAGSQGQRTVQQFAQLVSSKGDTVRGMVVDLELDMLHKFIGGLNSEQHRQYAHAELDRHPVNLPPLTVEALALSVAGYEQRKAQEMHSKIHALTMGSGSAEEVQRLVQQHKQQQAGSAAGSSSQASTSASLLAPSKGQAGQNPF
jgi:hypothetical protein